jgi:hypothetical protein
MSSGSSALSPPNNSVAEGSILAGKDITFGTEAELNGRVPSQSAVTFKSAGFVDALAG